MTPHSGHTKLREQAVLERSPILGNLLMKIRFGTSGWRAIIADDFTYDNVRLVTESILRYLKESHPAARRLIVGNDSRFMGERFSEVAARIAADKGYEVLVCNGQTPTPAISHAVRHTGAVGGINFTASHNPPEYQGMKFSTSDGAPALPEVTGRIEELVSEKAGLEDTPGGETKDFDARPDYLEDLASKVRFDQISSRPIKLAYDPLWGTGRGYLDKILRDHGTEVETLHDWRDVTFGGLSPEPGEKQLAGLREKVVAGKLDLGLATDGDGDRFGVIDSNGELITPNQLIALLADYLAESRGWNEGIARSVATSHLVDRVAESRGLRLHETPVGFKFIGELINRNEIILGGEESAGLSIKGHYPEKDGLLACLLAVEAVAARGAGLTEQFEELTGRIGNLHSGRIGVKLTPEIAKSLPEILDKEPAEIGGRKITDVNRLDGVKFLFEDGAWMLMRPSGTEPLVRIYAESEDESDLEKILEQGRKYLLG